MFLCEHPAVRLRQVIRPAAARGLGYWEEMEQLTKWKGTLAEAKGTPAEANSVRVEGWRLDAGQDWAACVPQDY